MGVCGFDATICSPLLLQTPYSELSLGSSRIQSLNRRNVDFVGGEYGWISPMVGCCWSDGDGGGSALSNALLVTLDGDFIVCYVFM